MTHNPFTAPNVSPISEVLEAEFEEIPAAIEAKVADIEAAKTYPDVTEIRRRLGLLTPEVVAAVLGVNWNTLKNWRVREEGPSHIKIGRRIWYRYQELETWIEELAMTNIESGQRRDYGKMSTNPNDTPGPEPKHSTHVEQPQEQPPTPEEVNAPPEDAVVGVPPELPAEPPVGGSPEDTGGDEAA